MFKKIGVLLLLLGSACNLDKDLQNPNEVSLSGADVDLLSNGVQLDLADFFNSAQGTVAPLVRQTAMTGGYRYQTNYQPQNQNFLWQIAYQALENAETLIPIAAEKNLTTHVASAKIMQAYIYLTLVDIFGDVPQAEALKGTELNFNPITTPGADVYAYAINLLTEARTELAKTGNDAGKALARDIYYGGDRKKWSALANTLELKAWVNISTLPARATEANTKIAALLGSDLIDTEAENFTYKYSATTVPDSRHPLYNQYYGPNAGQAGGYIATSFLYELFRGKPDPAAPTDATKFSQDPRWRYYFARQAGSITQIRAIDPKAIGCTPTAVPGHYAAGGYPFCVFDPGFYGRDHGDASGTPPDGPVLTAAGVYPAGGRPDNTRASNTSTFASSTKRGDGANGAGILPIYMSFYTDYLKAEILARGGDAAQAQIQLKKAIQNSIQSVKSFADGKGQTVNVSPWGFQNSTTKAVVSFTWTPGDNADCSAQAPVGGADPSPAYMNCLFNTSVNKYISGVDFLYANASSKLKIIGREFWVASWGNGLEAYNSYRRTSGPDIMQPTLQVDGGAWFRSMVYPANYVNLNSAAAQKSSDNPAKVFWDGNPDTLN